MPKGIHIDFHAKEIVIDKGADISPEELLKCKEQFNVLASYLDQTSYRTFIGDMNRSFDGKISELREAKKVAELASFVDPKARPTTARLAPMTPPNNVLPQQEVTFAKPAVLQPIFRAPPKGILGMKTSDEFHDNSDDYTKW